MDEPVLTVAIPTRNRCEYLRHALGLCSEVNSAEVEFLILNNSSDDGADEVLRQYEADKRFSIKNFATVGSINTQFLRAAECARGEWLVIIGDDDAVVPPMIDRLIEVLKTPVVERLSLVSWPQLIYRWAAVPSPEANFLRLWPTAISEHGQYYLESSLKNFLAFDASTDSTQKIYFAPGIYHSALRVSYVRSLLASYPATTFWGSPDISIRVHCCIDHDFVLRLTTPCTMAGYSPKSTGLSVTSAGSDTQLQSFKKENSIFEAAIVDHFQRLVNSGLFVPLTEVNCTYIILCEILKSRGLTPPSVLTYIRSELAGARKTSVESREKIKFFLNKLSTAIGVNIDATLLIPYDSTAPSYSLGEPHIRVEQVRFREDVVQTRIHGLWRLNSTYVRDTTAAMRFFCNLVMLK